MRAAAQGIRDGDPKALGSKYAAMGRGWRSA
jgi:hypothetical protein